MQMRPVVPAPRPTLPMPAMNAMIPPPVVSELLLECMLTFVGTDEPASVIVVFVCLTCTSGYPGT